MSASTSTSAIANPPAATTGTPRIVSIDIFRGLTMLVMIFVNDLGEVHGLPWWTYHAHRDQDLMTYVDMVFPFFLFIVGMSMPLAIARRLKQNPSHAALWLHILLRFCGLIVLGLILANADKADPARMPISGPAWALLGLTGGILFWLVPDRNPRHRRLYLALRVVGLLLLVFVYAIFRRTAADGTAAWIDGSYPEILGLIGYAYFSVALLYIPTHRWRWAPLAWFVILTAFCALNVANIIHWPAHLPLYFWPFGSGASASIIMAGVVTSTIVLPGDSSLADENGRRNRILLALAFAAVTLIAAWLFASLGISKIRATPTWCQASCGAAVLAFLLLYWICDIKSWTRWAIFVKPAGENTLLTYLLPDLYYFLTALIGFTYLERHLHVGRAGVLRAVVFTAFILAISAILTRCRIRLQL
jgi:heparan-alpha-glucosaminide N-acetyltransferase